MKNAKACLSVLTAFVLLFTFGTAASASGNGNADQYEAGIAQLDAWLGTVGEPLEDLEWIAGIFYSLDTYSMSKPFYYYTSVMIKAVRGTFDLDFMFWVSMLESNTRFQDYLQNELKSENIRTVFEMIDYANGREAEARGDTATAASFYSETLNFYDASERYAQLSQFDYEAKYNQARELMNANDLEGAYFLFAEISDYKDSADRMQFIVTILGYIPGAATPNPVVTATPTRTPRPVTPTPVVTAPPKATPRPVTPTPVLSVRDRVPTLSELYYGVSGKMKSKSDGRWQSRFGPGDSYPGAGAFKADKSHSNSLKVYFQEGSWVFAYIQYSSAHSRYAYLPSYAVSMDGSVRKISELDYYQGRTTRRTIPADGPSATSYEQFEDAPVRENTRLKIFFRVDSYVFAEFDCSMGTVRMWLPISDVALSN